MEGPRTRYGHSTWRQGGGAVGVRPGRGTGATRHPHAAAHQGRRTPRGSVGLPVGGAVSGDAVSVVIPTRNRRDLLLRTARSVLAQRDVDLSVIVVDEASADGSADAVLALGDPRVRVVRHRVARGVAAARNSGIAEVTTPWVAFIDDDDLWAPDKLCAQLAALRADPRAGWSCTGAVHMDAECRIFLALGPPEADTAADELLRNNPVPGGGSGVLAATAVVREIGGFDEKLSNLADWDFYLRLGQRARLAGVPRPLVGYVIHAGGMAHDVVRSLREFRYVD